MLYCIKQPDTLRIMFKYLWLILLAFPASLLAQDYNVAAIPDSVKANADAVLRYEELHVTIKGINKCVSKHKYAITILREAGDGFAGYTNYYDQLKSLSSIDGRLYDASGKMIRSVKKKDIADKSSGTDDGLANDNRYKIHNFYYRQYPYTVEYEEEEEYDGVFFLPSWSPVAGEKYGVVQSRFIVDVPAGYELRYKQLNTRSDVVTSGNDKTKTFTWELKGYAPVEYEPYQAFNIFPTVYIAPTDFQIGDYKGNMATWQNLGKFIVQLNNGRDVLPDNVKQDVHRIADGVTGSRAKAKALYDYLQKNTRYISIQLGIGGWQPFDAKYVGTKKYGDCKALSNYMYSLLKEAGVKSNYVLIKAGAGRRGLWEDFPSPYFNHAVLCVPDGKDTLWLECTNQTVSAGYMGDFTGGRKALMIDEDGGHVVSTPFYSSKDNSQLRKIDASVDAEGNLSAVVFTRFSGTQQDLQHELINGASKEQRDKYLNSTLRLPTYKVSKSNYTEIKKEVPEVDETLELDAPNYASVSGKRIFVEPNLFNKIGSKLTDDKPRKYDIRISDSFLDVDTAIIKVPSGYKVEAAPKDVSIESKFGKYSISFKFNDNSITVIRVHEEKQAIFPPADYADFMKYHNDMYKADRSRMVLVKME